jgi:PERQ amino acid-rich with GYF domain-containing protein
LLEETRTLQHGCTLFQRELREQQQLLQQQQQQQSQLHMQSQAGESSGSGSNIRGSSSLQLKWAYQKPLPVNKIKSLAEIQAEEQEQLAKVLKKTFFTCVL